MIPLKPFHQCQNRAHSQLSGQSSSLTGNTGGTGRQQKLGGG